MKSKLVIRKGGRMKSVALLASIFLLWAAGAAYAAPTVVDLNSGQEDVLIYGGDGSDYLAGTGASAGNSLFSGDVNGDGIDDLLAVARGADGPGNARSSCGEIYVFYGGAGIAQTWDVAGTNGAAPDVIIYGANSSDYLGDYWVELSDVNGDGVDDIIAAAPYGDGPANGRLNCGELNVIYGSASLPAVIDLANGDQDVIIYGAGASDYLGEYGYMDASDVNGDGINDIIVSARSADGPGDARASCGDTYVIYGSAALPAVIDLASGEEDVVIYGPTADDKLRTSPWNCGGDLNGDGINDIILSSNTCDGPADGRSNAGEVYVIFGSASLPASIDLASGGQNLLVYGANVDDYLGSWRNVGTGDFNGDGIDDLVMEAYQADGPAEGRASAGEAYIVYGATTLSGTVDLAAGEEDVTIYGSAASALMGREAGLNIGDVNGDGIKDLVLCSPLVRSTDGEVWVIYGSAALPAVIDLATGGEDVEIFGDTDDWLGSYTAMELQDLNGDGVDDLLLGAVCADGPANARSFGGEAYIIYGSGALPASISIPAGDENVLIYGSETNDRLTGQGGFGYGDLNGDGIVDLILGSKEAAGPGNSRSYCGEAYVVFGTGAFGEATAKNRDHAGANAPKSYGTIRATLEFASGDNASETVITLTRSKAALTLDDPDLAADCYWTFTSDRSNFSATVTFQYLAAEVAGLDESRLKMWKAANVGGPFEQVAGSTVDTATNTVTASGITGFSVFVLMEGDAPAEAPELNCFINNLKPAWGFRLPFKLPGLR